MGTFKFSKTGQELWELISGALQKSGGTMTGNLTVGNAKLETNGYITGTWLKATEANGLTSKPNRICVQDPAGWVYSRTPAQLLGDIGASAKPTYSTITMSASGWNNKEYSFETAYPIASNDIEISIDSSATQAQYEAFNAAQMVGSATTNKVKAFGDVPTIDIPIIIKVVIK